MDEWERQRYGRLKLLTVLGPTVFVAIGEWVRTYYLTPRFSAGTVGLVTVGVTLVGAIIFSWYVFRVMEKLETERRTYKEAVLALKERERIAREMHDGLAQNLAVLKLEAFKLKEACLHRDGALVQNLDTLESLLNQTYLEVRQSLYDLRVAQSLGEGFWPTVERQVQEFERRTGIKCILQPLNPPEELWNELASVQILRIIQEALANVRKHAHARRVDIRCQLVGRAVEFVIEDDGIGFQADPEAPPPDHYGLAVMRERAEAVGGMLKIESQPGRGTKVTVTVPVEGRPSDSGKSKNHASG
ncbi:signal transduction histidine kinase, nitrate/nitrite-specific, NarQ [Sulfobacillus acidophilus TPY]|uniref:Oxygen sensor histidine kinase NreB n=1 Tax=Sulfobacillus acidophilus (strain ATCC 700253 / DSM 10332 / NAL) TaxID=679936 RepID=G8TVX8_SULAD|nr:signal transduction histidine kinase, nitrate/nitrite-specific, NarQ [Sulfobacillus acidophilus TPY]AEW04822.1 integral membrane sensor signal transduction histidine kinase [Sulfobacillus acidophilus DSM 10332]MCY0864951.1 sensor histidine kinase [Sulfobacillus sp.]